ncbi:hypothetical protein [Pseudogracilibacillus auburnensis]|uniref:hypothetical protein n=1 Tax=Pseudogracilibacillus auburnensis TaxID=1494959 RepID=UPI001A973C6A|nr:hypothetical protein [Pseudogracilibacillus auburnensis]MBO1004096.1 hypothetical protein [Pseudogracilibacillus auburnensis]
MIIKMFDFLSSIENGWMYIVGFIVLVSILGTIIPMRLFFKKVESSFGEAFGEPLGESLQKNGVKTVGFIRTFDQTGVEINNQPQLKFTIDLLNEQDELVSASFKSVVLLTELADLEVGAPIAIIYDPQNRNKIDFDPYPNKDEMQRKIDLYESKQPGSISYEERNELRKQGKSDLAIVKNLQLTGRTLDEKPEITIDVEITTPSQTKIAASRTLYLQKEQLNNIQIGKVINIIYIPGKEENFYIQTALSSNYL